jgi:hypothetical protein
LFLQTSFPKDKPFVATILIVTSWIWSFLLAVPPLFGFGAFSVEDGGMGCAPSWKYPEDFTYNMVIFIVGFFLPLSIIVITSADLYYLIHKVFQIIFFSFQLLLCSAF